MKKYLLFCLLLLITLDSIAQSKEKNFVTAQKHYKKMQYMQALPFYLKALQKDTSSIIIREKIAHCYRRLQNTQEAEKYYATVVQSPITDPEDKLYYAQMLASNNKHEEAILWYNAYAKQDRSDNRPVNFSLAYQNISDFYKDSATIDVRLAAFNSPEDDFSPAWFGKNIVFVSNRNTQGEKFAWNNSAFLDLYEYEKGNVRPITSLNTPYHEGPVAFFPKGDSIIFTRNNTSNARKKDKKVSKLKLYIATRQTDGSWGKEKEFPHNNDEYNTMHPALSADGKTLYFVSDKYNNTLGGMDIFVSYFQNGAWSVPANLGEGINTRGTEVFPYVDKQGNLYFASTGHAGLGGLDIFISEKIEERLTAPNNLGYPINSLQDDFGLIIRGKKGYLSSNRAAGVGKDDIYEFTTQKNFYNFSELLLITRQEETLLPISQAEIVITSEQKATVNITNDEGTSKYFFNKKLHYDLHIQKKGFEDAHITLIPVQLASHELDDTIEIDLLPEKKAITIIKINSAFSKEPIFGNIEIIDFKTQKIMVNQLTEGKYEAPLDKGIYEVRVLADGYFLEIDTLQVWDKEAKTQKKMVLQALQKKAVWQIKGVDFEKNTNKFTKKSYKSLESLQKLLTKNKSLKINILAYCQDAKIPARNTQLSTQRAKAVYDYLVSKKIDKDRLQKQGLGNAKNNAIDIEITEIDETDNDNQAQPLKSVFDE